MGKLDSKALLLSRLFVLLDNPQLRHQLTKFVVTGFCGLFTDVTFYRFLVSLGLHVSPAKAFGCLSGTIVVFFINRSWTFSVTQRSRQQLFRFAALYGMTIALNTTLNTVLLRLIPHPWQVAFVIATAVTTLINFIGLKFVVFKARPTVGNPMDRDPNFSDSSPDTVAAP